MLFCGPETNNRSHTVFTVPDLIGFGSNAVRVNGKAVFQLGALVSELVIVGYDRFVDLV